MAQIRLQRTPELNEALAFLKSRYSVLSEAEIIKVALAEKVKKERDEDIPFVDAETEKMIGKALAEYKRGEYTVLKTPKDIEKHFDSL